MESKAEIPTVHLARSQSWPDPSQGPRAMGQDLHDFTGGCHQHQPLHPAVTVAVPRHCLTKAPREPCGADTAGPLPVDEDMRLRDAEPVATAIQLGSPGVELELKQPELSFNIMLLVLPQILSPDLHPQPGLPPPSPAHPQDPHHCTWMNSVPGTSSHWGLRRSSRMTEMPLLARLEPRLKPR